MKRLFHAQTIAAALFLCASQGTFALGKVSRACIFADIPPQLKRPALTFFGLLGMPSDLDDLADRSDAEQRKYSIEESITTDYGSLRYYLFAANAVYVIMANATGQAYYESVKYMSPWAAQSLDPAMFPDSRLKIFNFNRKVLFSARAGHPDIVTLHGPHIATGYKAKVIGQHYYYDPVSRVSVSLGPSEAVDCNLTEFGFEDR